jgi:hypothetical protein
MARSVWTRFDQLSKSEHTYSMIHIQEIATHGLHRPPLDQKIDDDVSLVWQRLLLQQKQADEGL